jgi:uncharacterized protein (TIGR00251 family)
MRRRAGWTPVADEALLQVRVTPRARRNALGGMKDGVLAVRLAAPPVEGAANKALIAFLAEALGLSRSAVRVESGLRSRHKKVRISGLTADEVARRLALGRD